MTTVYRETARKQLALIKNREIHAQHTLIAIRNCHADSHSFGLLKAPDKHGALLEQTVSMTMTVHQQTTAHT